MNRKPARIQPADTLRPWLGDKPRREDYLFKPATSFADVPDGNIRMHTPDLNGGKAKTAAVLARQFGNIAPACRAQFLALLTLCFLLGCGSTRAQSTAAFSISGVIPASQHLELSPVATSSTNPNQLVLSLNPKANVAESYTVTLQPRPTNNLPAPAGAYKLIYNGQPLTLASGQPTVLPVVAHQNSLLQISQTPAIPAAPLALTIISQ